MKRVVVVSFIAALMLAGCSEKKEQKSATTQTAEALHSVASAVASSSSKKSSAQESIKKVVSKESAPKKQQASDVKVLYAKCAACHGADGKRKALGKSAAIAGMSKEELVKKLQGYKAGSLNLYGMGALMKAQVSGLGQKDIEALADYIANLK